LPPPTAEQGGTAQGVFTAKTQDSVPPSVYPANDHYLLEGKTTKTRRIKTWYFGNFVSE